MNKKQSNEIVWKQWTTEITKSRFAVLNEANEEKSAWKKLINILFN